MGGKSPGVKRVGIDSGKINTSTRLTPGGFEKSLSWEVFAEVSSAASGQQRKAGNDGVLAVLVSYPAGTGIRQETDSLRLLLERPP